MVMERLVMERLVIERLVMGLVQVSELPIRVLRRQKRLLVRRPNLFVEVLPPA